MLRSVNSYDGKQAKFSFLTSTKQKSQLRHQQSNIWTNSQCKFWLRTAGINLLACRKV